VTAQKILDYRQRIGSFKGVEELTQAKLVTASTYEKIKDLVIVR
jgi:DNA uptake protein ComE-like DNA-binding protein